ncbi:undecaprenyl-diphosphate phosphatase [Halorussus aquaticus]|uniref:Undecaprenyl-diphosphatase n=1 Tax=Halorussus aquaticus TaxID=2953748 RepID=A0ABD5Q6C3_9EURY|nr:undecaprenyl-diphosphate phosphatase [Halorussus aquaticus]
MNRSALVAVAAGALQGVFEWLPISSEGNITVFLTALGSSPEAAVQFSLFLHAGTALSAAVYYRDELRDVLAALPHWRPGSAFDPGNSVAADVSDAPGAAGAPSAGAGSADRRVASGRAASQRPTLSFLGVATLASGVVGIAAYATLDRVVSALTGGAFVALVGVLLVLTGVLQRVADDFEFGGRESPDLVDAVLVGALQGLAILPGVSRSGTTTSALLFRGHDGPSSFRLSFLLSIPAALGAGVLVLLDTGVPEVAPTEAALALGTAAVVGYLTIDALMRVVERVPFWSVCVGLGALAILGGGALAI